MGKLRKWVPLLAPFYEEGSQARKAKQLAGQTEQRCDPHLLFWTPDPRAAPSPGPSHLPFVPCRKSLRT